MFRPEIHGIFHPSSLQDNEALMPRSWWNVERVRGPGLTPTPVDGYL